MRAARAYVGMEFRHQGRARPGDGKSARIDCAGLLVCVGEDLGLIDRAGRAIIRADYADKGPQPHDGYLHAECERRLETRETRLDVSPLNGPRPGDVVTLRAPNSISHCGFIGADGAGALTLIFPYPVRLKNAIHGRIVEVRFDERWRGRLVGAFYFPGVIS
jgi:hypothetical protein